jgi:hypothetical protein
MQIVLSFPSACFQAPVLSNGQRRAIDRDRTRAGPVFCLLSPAISFGFRVRYTFPRTSFTGRAGCRVIAFGGLAAQRTRCAAQKMRRGLCDSHFQSAATLLRIPPPVKRFLCRVLWPHPFHEEAPECFGRAPSCGAANPGRSRLLGGSGACAFPAAGLGKMAFFRARRGRPTPPTAAPSVHSFPHADPAL